VDSWLIIFFQYSPVGSGLIIGTSIASCVAIYLLELEWLCV